MRKPRVRFTVRSIMTALGALAAILAMERPLFQYAVSLVTSHNEYLWDEAVTVWVILNIALSLPIALSVAIVRAATKDQAEARQRDDGSIVGAAPVALSEKHGRIGSIVGLEAIGGRIGAESHKDAGGSGHARPTRSSETQIRARRFPAVAPRRA
jgi:hypothetical protein